MIFKPQNTPNRSYIIAEAGVNHNGSIDMAKALVDAAVKAGVDAVKFQTFSADKLVSKQAQMAEYQKQNTQQERSQYQMLKELELTTEDHKILQQYCQRKQIMFLSTPFDIDSLHMLDRQLHVPKIKIGSGDLTNAPLLLAAAQTGKPVILSTGMSTLAEVETALGVLAFGYINGDAQPSEKAFIAAWRSKAGKKVLQEKVVLLHCTTEYPTPFSDVNLRAMQTMATAFELPVGFSDHTPGITIPIAAAALGATVIEKHFTLDKDLPGPDHKASLAPEELTAMVSGIRQVEAALGNGEKTPAAAESKNRLIARRVIVAAKTIHKGEHFTIDNLAVKRAGSEGLAPIRYWDLQGKTAKRDYQCDEVIDT